MEKVVTSRKSKSMEEEKKLPSLIIEDKLDEFYNKEAKKFD
jgi:hypothetical protein